MAYSSEDRSQSIGVCAVVLNSENEVLLGKRKNSYRSGWYGLPGGPVEVNEQLESALQRELAEETGLVLTDREYVGVVRENQGKYDFIHFIFLVRSDAQEPKLLEPDKCESWEWFSVETIPENTLPGHAAAVALFMKNESIADLTQ